MKKTTGYLRLMRPANIVTSVADVLAGIAISGYLAENSFHSENLIQILLLCFSTVGLYGGGVVFNDVFDAALDRVERPERPIPAGLITLKEAAILGAVMLIAGVLAAAYNSIASGVIALAVAISALVYDKWGKHLSLLGPVNMGLCRGLNLLLGISIFTPALQHFWFLAIVPVIYIASITMISRGEVHGGSKPTLYTASALYCLVIGFILFYAVKNARISIAVLFLIAFAWMIFTPLLKAIKEPVGKNIGKAVKAGVLALVLMNAAWAAASGELYVALVIILLLPLSLWLGKIFAVT